MNHQAQLNLEFLKTLGVQIYTWDQIFENISSEISVSLFCKLYKGILNDQEVVIKVLDQRLFADQEQSYNNFVDKALLSAQNFGQNVLSLRGISCDKYFCLIFDFMNTNLTQALQCMSASEKFHVAYDIACGMHELQSRNINHLLLNVNNVLLDKRNRALVSDFMTSQLKSLSKEDFIQRGASTLQYLPPQAFTTGETQGWDAWSFGCIVIHMYSGSKPWPNYKQKEIIEALTQGQAPQVPLSMPEQLKMLLYQCFSEPSQRPSFAAIKEITRNLQDYQQIQLSSINLSQESVTSVDNNFLADQLDIQRWKELNRSIYHLMIQSKKDQIKLQKELNKAQSTIKQQSDLIEQQHALICFLQQQVMDFQVAPQEQIKQNQADFSHDYVVNEQIEQQELKIEEKVIQQFSKTFSNQYKSPNVKLVNDNMRAMFPGDQENLCLIEIPLTPGQLVTILFRMVDGYGFDFGICEVQQKYDLLLREVGYAFYNGGNPAYLYKDNKEVGRYGKESWRQGDVEMIINTKDCTISFAINGQPYGTAFQNIDFSKNYFPAISSSGMISYRILEIEKCEITQLN